jgi:hypothetical protein
MFHFIKDLIIKIKFKRTAKKRRKAYNSLHQTPYGPFYRNQGYYE